MSHNFPGGMILSGVVTFFFGFAKFADIHSFGYLIAMQASFFPSYNKLEITKKCLLRC